MKIIIAIDSFKGSASSQELNQAVKKGLLAIRSDAEIQTFEIADGGEGTISALQHGLGGELISVETVDLLERPITANYLFLPNQTALIEAAEVVGIDKITPSPETITNATTKGLAALFIDAKNRGAREIVLSLGVTGTSDGGLGLLQGLGGSFEELPKLENVKITGLADVTNVYAGETGYAKFFGKQKGGTLELLEQQNENAQKVAQSIKEKHQIDLQAIAGTGAAGGLGGAVVLLGGTVEAGFPKIAQLLNIEKAIQSADLVITGEGRMDIQSANGKVPYGMAQLARKYGLPTIAFCGALSDNLGKMDEVLLASFSIQRSAISLDEAMKKERTLENIERLTKNVMKTWLYQ